MKKVGNSHWLTAMGQEIAIKYLVESSAGLLVYNREGNLPIKGGSNTDIYVHLRNARNDPGALEFLAELYTIPLRSLKVERFGEVPDAVSCFAGPLSIKTRLPYVTIREQAKDDRVSNAKTIGCLIHGEPFVIIDDVITDGGSKIIPAKVCLSAGVDLGPVIVLVDRQQGWKKRFADENLGLDVWSGLTLDHIRDYLTEHNITHLP